MPTVAPAGPVARDVRAQLAEALSLVAGSDAADAAGLAELLYAQWYARPRHPFVMPSGCPPDLAEMLRAAHAGFRHWERGWRIEDVGARGQAVVRRGSELRLLERCDYSSTARPGLLPRRGDQVAVTGRRDRVDPAERWWRTSGRSWSWVAAPAGLVRVYFNVELAGLPALIERLTGLLAEEDEPWLVKCATDPAVHARADATVAYLTRDAIERRAAQIVDVALGAGDHARTTGPPLTMPVVAGLAVAVDPGCDESFGMHRCRLIAEATGADVEAVLERFARDGVDAARPWARRDDPRLPWER
jgi:hypothetical protein